jgi:hypothetical protein
MALERDLMEEKQVQDKGKTSTYTISTKLRFESKRDQRFATGQESFTYRWVTQSHLLAGVFT